MAFISNYEKLETQTVVSVVDVYDLAATIGKEFECIIDVFGVEAVTNLMPKVIRSLEMLESMAVWAEHEQAELEDSQYTVQRLQREKLEKAHQKQQFEKELEQYEDKWRVETQDLLDVISKLQLENRKMGTALQERDKAPSPTESRDEEIKLMNKMKSTIDKQRDQIRTMKKDIDQKTIDNEAMSAQVERLAKLNVELRRKHSVTSRQAKSLIEEKTTLQAQLQGKEQEITKIREYIHIEESPSSPLTPTKLKEEMEAQLQQDGKVLIDMKDPNRPRFTLSELREVILERNELKTKLIEVEEELSQYRTKDEPDDSELPVHGPINREPYSKMYPDGKPGETGIRRFFSNLFSRSRSPRNKEPPSKKASDSEVRRSSVPDLASSRHRHPRPSAIMYLPLPGSNLPI